MQVVFNELSSSGEFSRAEAKQHIDTMVSLLRELKKMRPGFTLLSVNSLMDEVVGDSYSVRDWYAQAKASNRDLARWLLALLQQAPMSRLSASSSNDFDYTVGGVAADGLGWAHLLDGIAISVSGGSSWGNPTVRVVRHRLSRSGDLIEDEVDVRHMSCSEHKSAHEDWLTTDSLDFRTGAEIWTARDDAYPNLRFLARVEPHLRDLESFHIGPVARELALINRAIGDWDPQLYGAPAWRSNVTPEYEQRRSQGYFDFADDDGVVYTFDLHGRFTPGHGRVHLRLDAKARKGVVAHVGTKLGV